MEIDPSIRSVLACYEAALAACQRPGGHHGRQLQRSAPVAARHAGATSVSAAMAGRVSHTGAARIYPRPVVARHSGRIRASTRAAGNAPPSGVRAARRTFLGACSLAARRTRLSQCAFAGPAQCGACAPWRCFTKRPPRFRWPSPSICNRQASCSAMSDWLSSPTAASTNWHRLSPQHLALARARQPAAAIGRRSPSEPRNYCDFSPTCSCRSRSC